MKLDDWIDHTDVMRLNYLGDSFDLLYLAEINQINPLEKYRMRKVSEHRIEIEFHFKTDFKKLHKMVKIL